PAGRTARHARARVSERTPTLTRHLVWQWMIAAARLAAYEVLRAVNRGRGDLPAALARVRASLDDERDRALAGEIATGTLRWQGACDAGIAAFAGRALAH